MITGIVEKEIARVWERQLFSGEELATEEGEPLEIIEPGWLNDDRGPDFKDAVLRLGGVQVNGDVEVHVRSSGWWEHGHHLDAVYDRVILHVVMWHDAGEPVRLSGGGRASTLVLRKCASVPLSDWPGLTSAGSIGNCRHLASAVNGEAATFLDRAGEERFLEKAARFGEGLRHDEAGQCLYEGVMGALGYSRNKLPFLELARRVPLRVLEDIAAGGTGEEWVLARAAALLGASGLLAVMGQRDLLKSVLRGGEAKRLLELAEACSSSVRMSPQDWHVLKVRPANSPALRLIALGYLLLRYREVGWLEGLTGLVRQAPEGVGGPRSFEDGLEVKRGKLTMLGRERAADIAVNVLLPFTFAWSKSVSEPGLGEKAFSLYRIYTRLAENSVEKQMTARLGLGRELVNSARRQQGLLHIYKNFCSRGGCGGCRMSKLKA